MNNKSRKTKHAVKPLLSKNEFAHRMALRFSPFVRVNTTRDGFIWFA